MLHDFLTSNRGELIIRCWAKVAKRSTKLPAVGGRGVPLFLSQLVDTLVREQSATIRSVPGPGPEEEAAPAAADIGRAAALHGAELLRYGYSVDQVVHDYGDVCQAVTELAGEQNVALTVDEFHTLNRCLDNAIADAVTAFTSGREIAASDETTGWRKQVSTENELRMLIKLAIQAFSAIQTGNIGVNGATGTALLNTLCDLRDLIGKSPPEIRRTRGKSKLSPP